jgi:hypothetical protein
MFNLYKHKPSFPIIKDDKKSMGEGVGGKPPPPDFGRSVNPIVIQFGFFHPIGYLKINRILFEPV